MKTVIVIGLAAALTGCVSARQAEVRQKVEAGRVECSAQNFKTKTELARCINEAERLIGTVYHHPDLLNLRMASRLAIAERQDRGELTQAQADLEFAKLGAEITSQEQGRNNSAQMAAAASAMATPRMTTCNRYGNTVTCF